MINALISNPLVFLIGLIAILASLSFHEFSHAVAGTLLGDDTARRAGRLTLNPVAHVDFLGLLALVTVGFGWGKPVPFNPYNLREQKWGPALVGAAGPFSNLLLIVIAAAALRIVLTATGLQADNALVFFLAFMVQINAALLFFNLIPIPPLDGSKFLLSALSSPKHYALRQALETKGPIYLLLLILGDSLIFNGLIFGTLFRAVVGVINAVFGLNGAI